MVGFNTVVVFKDVVVCKEVAVDVVGIATVVVIGELDSTIAAELPRIMTTMTANIPINTFCFILISLKASSI